MQFCLGRTGCFGSKGRRGRQYGVPGSSSRGSAGSEVSTTTCSLSDSSSSDMMGLVGLVTPDNGGNSRNLLHHQERRCGKCSSASGVVPLGIKPRFAERQTLFRGHAVLVANTVTCPSSAALPVITPTLSPPCLRPCTDLLQLSRRERRWKLRGRLGKNNGKRTRLEKKP